MNTKIKDMITSIRGLIRGNTRKIMSAAKINIKRDGRKSSITTYFIQI
jgi:hypothetical protein